MSSSSQTITHQTGVSLGIVIAIVGGIWTVVILLATAVWHIHKLEQRVDHKLTQMQISFSAGLTNLRQEVKDEIEEELGEVRAYPWTSIDESLIWRDYGKLNPDAKIPTVIPGVRSHLRDGGESSSYVTNP